MSSLKYASWCICFILLEKKKINILVNCPPLFFPSYGNPCRSQSPSTNTRRSDILLREGKKAARTIVLKSDDKSSLSFEKENTSMNEWVSSSLPVDQIGGWNLPVQICRRGMVPAVPPRQSVPQRDAVHRYVFELGTLVGWRRRRRRRGAVGLKKKEKWNLHSLLPLFSSSSPPTSTDAAACLLAAAAADDDDVDQRKVTEGKMHIEKALGNIWCRRQRRLYHSSGGERGKKMRCQRNMDGPLWYAGRMYHRFHIRDAKPVWRGPRACMRCPASKGRLMLSAPPLLRTLSKETWSGESLSLFLSSSSCFFNFFSPPSWLLVGIKIGWCSVLGETG